MIDEILRFNIPNTSPEFNQYIYEQFQKGTFTNEIYRSISDDLINCANGLPSELDKRINDEFNIFQEQGFGAVEFAFIVLKSCYNVGSIYHGF
jgi:hypothetical protein